MKIKITKSERFSGMPFKADILEIEGVMLKGKHITAFGDTPEDALIDVLREHPPVKEDTIEIIRAYILKPCLNENVYLLRDGVFIPVGYVYDVCHECTYNASARVTDFSVRVQYDN